MKSKFFLIIVMVFVISIGFAQPGDPGGGADPDVPITGIEILIGIGSLFGASRFFKSKNTKNKEQ